jgi:peptidoglycan/xylan/chitin deacetylase (PgdA/CDA1 family)
LDHYNLADVFPSELEGFGFSVAEAMACGRPVVASDRGSLPEVLIDGEGGFLADPADAAALARKVLLLLSDPRLRAKLGAANRARAERCFGWEQCAAATKVSRTCSMHGGPVALSWMTSARRPSATGVGLRACASGRRPAVPGNWLFLKYCPGIRRWGPYRELSAAEWHRIIGALADAGARMTVAITAAWVERDGRLVPFPAKFPDAAAAVREGARAGRLEVANHGYTHCLLEGGRFRPRLFSGNRQFHREFFDWLPAETHREHLRRAQGVLEDFFESPVLTLVPPGNVFSPKTLAAAAEVGIRYVCCRDAARFGERDGLVFVDDRDVVLGGVERFASVLAARPRGGLVTVRELAAPRARTAEPRS